MRLTMAARSFTKFWFVGKFADDVAAFAERTEEDVSDVMLAFKLGLFGRIIRGTRVDTGRLRGNWQVSDEVPITTEIERLSPVASAVDASEMSRIDPLGTTWLSNNLVYAMVWEERDAMVGRAIADATRALEEAARSVR